jgi:hypothetical protein
MNLDELWKSAYEEGFRDGMEAKAKITPSESCEEANLILDVCTKFYKIALTQMASSSRRREVVIPRMVSMHLLRIFSPLSLKNIGRLFGDRDHTTVIHACNTVRDIRSVDEDFDQDVKYLESNTLNLVVHQEPVFIEPKITIKKHTAAKAKPKKVFKINVKAMEEPEKQPLIRPQALYSNTGYLNLTRRLQEVS